ncbi:hypothetical protein [Eilatimonas milleporae]|uniref:Uncharacterized protein n=1 Tax=Eilatimonas milleporae TaxID=911205 RepID=A0A3M0C573_9PROT|nr:hypothetical protein [Eilatimonas milleporae]RMB04878.1 hypothetical protein BXY39_2449 [Eilatimonas milleporae]
MRVKDRNWFIKALTSPYLWAGLLVGAGGGTAFAYSMLLGSLWWRPFYEWQSLIAGLLALVGAGVAFFAVRQQIQAAKEIEETRRKEDNERTLATLLADLSVEALELCTIHANLPQEPSTSDKTELTKRFNGLLRYPPRLSGLLDFTNLMSLRTHLKNYYDTLPRQSDVPSLPIRRRVEICRSDEGTWSIDNFEILGAIFEWASLYRDATDKSLTDRLKCMRSAELQPESQTGDSASALDDTVTPEEANP